MPGTMLGAGIYFGVPADVYHSDPCPEPSLSHSIARTIAGRSAKHAWQIHPRLNGEYRRGAPTQEMQDGSCIHAYVLGGHEDLIITVDAEDWRTKAAQEIRDTALAEGKIAVLKRRIPGLQAAGEAACKALKEHEDSSEIFALAEKEATVIWQEGGIYCRSRVDLLPNDPAATVYDFKFTTKSAAPADYEKTVWSTLATQAVFYSRGLEAARQVRPRGFKFIACEMSPPYGAAVFEIGNDLWAYAEDQIETAIIQWATSIESGSWRSYPRRTVTVGLPGWLANRWENEQTLTQIGRRASMERVEAVAGVAKRLGKPLS
jgi:hypothetical protein